MKTRSLIFPIGALLLLPALGFAQSYSIAWYKISGGGGASSGGAYHMAGTIGQHDAGAPMAGGEYSLTGGFWSFIAVAQTPGLPALTITRSGSSVIISWPNTGTYSLQQNSNIATPAAWAASAYEVTSNANGTSSITITPPSGNLFFRLAKP